MSVERKLAAILAADVVGYSRLMGADEQGTLDRLRECRQTIDRLIDEHHGRFVGSAGDSVLAEFASSVDAVSCAWQIQKSLASRNDGLPENQRMEYRIGVNLGDVMVDGPQIYGDGVNVAARLEGLADTGGIALSGSVHEQVRTKVDYVFDDMGLHKAKNIDEPIHVYEVRLNPDDPPPKWRKEHQSRFAAWQWIAIGASSLIVFQVFIFGIWTAYTAHHNSANLASVLDPRPLPDKLAAGARFSSCGLCPEMTVIKQGSLSMGMSRPLLKM